MRRALMACILAASSIALDGQLPQTVEKSNKWVLSTGARPAMPEAVSPADGSTGVPLDVDLTFETVGATTCDVRLGTTTSPVQVVDNGPCVPFRPPTLQPLTKYYWHVVGVNENGIRGPRNPWSFTTRADVVKEPVDCQVSDWQLQETKTTGCVNGTETFTDVFSRSVLVQPENGGKACPADLGKTETRTQACTDPKVPIPAGLMGPEHLQEIGSFRLPAGFEYASNGAVYNKARNSLFITGGGNRTAEVTIPALSKSTRLSDLQTAQYLQPLTDATDGKIVEIMNLSSSKEVQVGGYVLYADKICLTVYLYYDGSGAQKAAHLCRPQNLSIFGQSTGWMNMNVEPWGAGGGWVSGAMADIPPNWVGAFGGTKMTMQCCIPIISRTSSGPSFLAWEPSLFPNNTRMYMQLLYPPDKPLARFDDPVGNDLFNGPTQVHGVVFPKEFSSILYFGRHGTGPYCYGLGWPTLPLPAPKHEPDGSVTQYCLDPTNSDKGNHTYPYHYQVWAYNANDLLAVKAGTKKMWEPRPYTFWRLKMPFGIPHAEILGAAYDPDGRRIFVVQAHGDGAKPVVTVYQIVAGTAGDARTTENAPMRSSLPGDVK